MRLLLFCFLCSLGLQNAFAQHTIEDKMKWYAMSKPTSNLFVHFDKNVYSNNETVYFTGYLIKEAKLPVAGHKIMAVALIRDADSALIADDKFIMTNGLSFGSMKLPDSIPTGGYRFFAYSDRLINNMPEVLFIQNITIKSSIDPSFRVNLKLIDQPNEKRNSLKVLISATGKEGNFLTKPAKINYNYGKIRKGTATDASGQSIISLPIERNQADPNLYVKLKYENDSTFIRLSLPQPPGKALVKFYPEGGNMVNGLPSSVSWEVKDLQNRPIELKAVLLKNTNVIDTIETSSYGIGKFTLRPQLGVNYAVKLIYPNLIDTIYNLPIAIDKGLTLTVENAVVKDTLIVNLKSTEKLNLSFLVHNFKSCFLNFPYQMASENIRVKIPLTEIPKGLTTLTIIDSLNRPLAERVFFAHYTNEERISITSDQSTYKQREKVSLKLNLTQDENALVSIATVQDSRLELKKMNDIESYTYLTNELNNLPVQIKGRPYKDINYIEQMLLVKGWRRYTWQNLLSIKPADTTSSLDSLMINGKVVQQKKKKINEPITVGTMGSRDFNLITTHEGSFTLLENQLITPAEKKMYAFVNKTPKPPYDRIEIDDKFITLNQKLSKITANDQPILFSTIANNAELVLKNNEKMIRLKEVVITNKEGGFNYEGPNACGDYVCPYNILNCRNHPGDPKNRRPIKGNLYFESSGNSNKIPYAGCTLPDQNIFTLVKGIHQYKEFYVDEYKDPNEPAFYSTIYWKYGVLLNTKKETELSFYTSDITGKFRIVVQGITNKDVIYGEHFFEVVKK